MTNTLTNYFDRQFTVHTSRTMMYRELSHIMDYIRAGKSPDEAAQDNVAGKLTQKNQKATYNQLKKLYSLHDAFPPFVCFSYFWNKTSDDLKPLLTFLYAAAMDYMLAGCMETGKGVSISFYKGNNNNHWNASLKR